MHEENGLAEQEWRTMVIVKDLILIDSSLPNNFWAEAIEIANYFYNRLLIKSMNYEEVISKKSWTGGQ